MVHFVCALLASGIACADSFPVRMVAVVALAAHWHHDGGRLRVVPHFAVSPGPLVGLEETCLQHLIRILTTKNVSVRHYRTFPGAKDEKLLPTHVE